MHHALSASAELRQSRLPTGHTEARLHRKAGEAAHNEALRAIVIAFTNPRLADERGCMLAKPTVGADDLVDAELVGDSSNA